MLETLPGLEQAVHTPIQDRPESVDNVRKKLTEIDQIPVIRVENSHWFLLQQEQHQVQTKTREIVKSYPTQPTFTDQKNVSTVEVELDAAAAKSFETEDGFGEALEAANSLQDLYRVFLSQKYMIHPLSMSGIGQYGDRVDSLTIAKDIRMMMEYVRRNPEVLVSQKQKIELFQAQMDGFDEQANLLRSQHNVYQDRVVEREHFEDDDNYHPPFEVMQDRAILARNIDTMASLQQERDLWATEIERLNDPRGLLLLMTIPSHLVVSRVEDTFSLKTQTLAVCNLWRTTMELARLDAQKFVDGKNPYFVGELWRRKYIMGARLIH
jgi:hypothetical protein